MWPPLAATTARHRRVIDPMVARGRFGVTDIAVRRTRVRCAARASRKAGRNFSAAARNSRFTSSQKPRRNLTVSNRAWEIPLRSFGAVGCGPLPVEEAVAGGAAGNGSEVNGVALEGAAAPAGGGRRGKRRFSERCRDHRRRRQRRHGKSSGDTCANTRVAHPGGPSPQDARTPTYPRVPPSDPAKKLLLRHQNRRPRSPRQQTPNSKRTPNANSQPPYGQHTANTRSTHGQHTANTTVNISRFE